MKGESAAPMPIVVGFPRSGTTLLRMMLDAHPDLAIPPETGFLPPAARILLRGTLARTAVFWVVTHSPRRAPAWTDFGIPREEFRRKLDGVVPFTVTAGLRCFYRCYAESSGKPRWGDKTPGYCRHLRRIERVLPEAHFAHVIRDGRDAALSLRDQWFAPGRDMTTLAKRWQEDIFAARAQGARCRRYLEIRYEELVLDTRTVLERICEFVALPYDAAMELYYERAPERLREHQERRDTGGRLVVSREDRLRQQQRVCERPDPSRIGRWRTAMTLAERREFESVAGPLLCELGYHVGHG